MIDSELIRFLREEIKRQINIILPGVSQKPSQNEKGSVEDIVNMYPGMDVIEARPVMHPYGLVSKASSGTAQVVGKMGTHEGNRFVLGHRDATAPLVPNEGETILYSKEYVIRVLNDKIEVGKDGVFEVVPVGDTLKILLSSLIDLIVAHTHPSPGSPPTNSAAFTALKTNNLDNDKILAKDGGRF